MYHWRITEEKNPKIQITNWVQITIRIKFMGDFEFQINDMQIVLKRIRMSSLTHCACSECYKPHNWRASKHTHITTWMEFAARITSKNHLICNRGNIIRNTETEQIDHLPGLHSRCTFVVGARYNCLVFRLNSSRNEI